jgi:hypothetical protein
VFCVVELVNSLLKTIAKRQNTLRALAKSYPLNPQARNLAWGEILFLQDVAIKVAQLSKRAGIEPF